MSHHYTFDQLVAALRQVGVQAGDIIFTHVDLAALGMPELTNANLPSRNRRALGEAICRLIYTAVTHVIGEGGTWLVPTYSYSFGKQQLYDPATTPSSVGTFTEWFRQQPDVMRSDDGGDSWREVSGNLPSDFGFVIDVHAHEPETIYVVPIKSDSEHYPLDGKLQVYRSRSGGNEWEPLTNGLPQSNCYVNVLRDAMAIDSLDECGVYFGTTGGQVYCSPDGGDNWSPIVRDLPAVVSVEVQTLP